MSRLAFVLFVISCVPPSSAPPAAPYAPAPAAPAAPPELRGGGNWNTTWYWNAGNCGLAGQLNHTLSVAETAAGYVISEPDPSVAITGTMDCTSEQCNLLVSETAPINGAPANVSVNFTLRANGSIGGSGSVSFTSPACSQSFTATGWRT